MLLLLALLLFFDAVNAASSFANIMSKATLPTSKPSSTVAFSSFSSCPDVAFDCNRPGPYGFPEIVEGEYNIYKNEYTGSVASICSASFESSLNAWEATAAVETFSQIFTPETGGPAYTTQYNVQFSTFFSFAAAPPCCGNCTLFGGDVQVYYWPTPAPTPGVTELVNAVDFTFTSPSIYVAFNSLYATDLCGHLGKDIEKTTIGFPPGALSTALAYQFKIPEILDLSNNFTIANFGNEPKDCPNITTSFIINNVGGSTFPPDQPLPTSVQSYCEATPISCDLSQISLTYNPCSPTLSVPSQLFTLNAQWKTCIQGIDAFLDPPFVLTKGSGLTAFNAPASPTPSPSPSPSAQPQTTPNAPTPTPTLDPPPFPSADASPSADPSPSAVPPPSEDPSRSPSPDPPPSAGPFPSVKLSPSPPAADPSPNQNPTLSPNEAPSQGSLSQQPQILPQATPKMSPVFPNNPGATASTTPIPFVAGTHTITPGSPAAVISGTTFSVPSSGGVVIINNSITQSISQPQAPAAVPFLVGTHTITPGSPAAVISGTTYSVPSSGGAVIINNSMTQFVALQAQSGQTGELIRTYILGSQTLVAGGPAITISSSVVVSLMSGGESVVVEGSSTTETLAITAAFTSTDGIVVSPSGTGLGGVIASIGGFTTPTSTSVPANGSAAYTGLAFQGVGSRVHGAASLTAWVISAGATVLWMMVLCME